MLNIVLYSAYLIFYIVLLQVFKYILFSLIIGIIVYKLKNGLFNSKRYMKTAFILNYYIKQSVTDLKQIT